MRRDRWIKAALGVTAGTVLLTSGVCGLFSRWLAVPDPEGAPGSVAAAPAASPSPPATAPDDHGDAILGRSLFDSSPGGGGGGGGGGGAVGTVDAMLILTAVADDPVYSTALIVEAGADEPAVYAEGDALAGATVEHIERTRVTVLLPDGERETLRLGQPKPHKIKMVDGKPPKEDLRDGITKIDDTHFTIERETLEIALAKLGDFAKDASVVPNITDGKAAGYRLVKVRKHGVVAELGLRKNDVLTGVNGLPVEPATLLEALPELKQADEIELSIERNGTPLVVQYEIR